MGGGQGEGCGPAAIQAVRLSSDDPWESKRKHLLCQALHEIGRKALCELGLRLSFGGG
jgi:hypothetical protein